MEEVKRDCPWLKPSAAGLDWRHFPSVQAKRCQAEEIFSQDKSG